MFCLPSLLLRCEDDWPSWLTFAPQTQINFYLSKPIMSLQAGSNEIWQLLGRQRRSLVLVVGCFDSVSGAQKKAHKKKQRILDSKKSNLARFKFNATPQSSESGSKLETLNSEIPRDELDIRYLYFCCHQKLVHPSTHTKRDRIRCPHQQLKYSFQLLCTLVIF